MGIPRILFAAWAMAAPLPATALERLANGGFDQWSGEAPDSWERLSGCLVTPVGIGDGNLAARLGSGGASATQALAQTVAPFDGRFRLSLIFSQEAPAGGLRGMNVNLRGSSEPILSLRSSPSGTLEAYDGASSAWMAVPGTTGAIQPSVYGDGNPGNDFLYRVEIEGDPGTGTYTILLEDQNQGTVIASATNLAWWQSVPTSSSVRAVHLERGRSGADWTAHEVSLDEVDATTPFTVDPDPPHPFLIVSEEEYPAWREKALREPWSGMKAKALQAAATLTYDPAFSGSYRSKVLGLKTVVSACALSSILDPANAATHADKAAAEMIAGLTDIRDTRGAVGGWEANTPVGSTLFSCILALDVLHAHIPEATRLQIEGLVGPLANSISGWNPSPQSVRCLWALYRGDASAYHANVSSYMSALLDLFTDDGVMLAGPGYGNARLNYFDREQKHALTDILARLGAMDTYPNRKIQRVYEWLYGSAYGHQGELHVFGDTSANRPLWGPPGEYPQDSPTAAYRAWRYSAAAQTYANRLIVDPSPQPSLLGYALLGTPTRDLPAANAPSRIFPDGGAFFRENTDDPGGLSSGLLCLTRSEGHTHKEVNSISLIGHGEHLVSNSGYAGAGSASLGFSWTYINNRAVSGNTVLIDYPVSNAANASATRDHASKSGAGIVRGFTAEGIDYAVGDSGSAMASGTHQRGMAFIHPDAALGLPGHWILFDRVVSASGTNAQMALHPFSADVTTVDPGAEYRWFVQRDTGTGAYLTVHLASPPSGVQLLDGVFANLNPAKSFVGKFLYATYPIQSGGAHFATVLVPRATAAGGPAATRSSGAGYHRMDLDWGTAEDHILTSATASAPLASGNITWTGTACHVRTVAGVTARFFIDRGTAFSAENVSFSSSSPAVAAGTSQGLVVSTDSPGTVSVRWPGASSAFVGHSVVAVAADGAGTITLPLPAGEHRIRFGSAAQPSLRVSKHPDTSVLSAAGLLPGRAYRYEASGNLTDWSLLKEGIAPTGSDIFAEPGPHPERRFYRIVLPQNP
ncbi:hypothetical protein OVA24_00560 [Luteolibacter sp. SL250]|uniref:hypothetical protein n=1 Tax=Luteolibacter sp. SL250 TaxID=2995170 RepID=UPI00226FAEC6|nr:hypothetical protein [Luteolibacter sp. SL250]WAC19867.1 hypothetical protein OVA24_00560 [Luteolibacter sp. SL250]